MKTDLRITFHGFHPDGGIEARIRERFERLEQLSERITSCHVTLEIPHRHHKHGKHFKVCIQLAVPGRTIVVSRDPAERTEHEDVFAAIDDAFTDARRALESYVRVRRGDVKRHAEARR